MRVLITGGNGFVGRAVTSALQARGHDVTVGSRRGAPVGEAPGVTMDVTESRSVKEAFDRVKPQGVVHLVGIIRERGHQTFERVHVEATRNVVAASASLSPRLLHMSALGARVDSPSRYASSKGRAEGVVRESGLPFTMFRPSLIFGPGDDFFGTVLRNLVSLPPVVPVIGSGAFPFRPVSVQDVAQAFAVALESPETVGETFDLAGPVEYRFDDLLRLEMRVLGKRKPLVHVPLPLMRLVMPVMQLLPNAPITGDQFLMLIEGNTADPARARDTLHLPMRRLEDELPLILGRHT